VDVSWAYDPVSDFPVTLNPFAIVNSLLAGLPTNLLGGLNGTVLTKADGTPTDLTGLGLSIAGTLGIPNRLLALPVTDGEGFYATLVPNDLPLLEPLRLPSRLINLLTGFDLPTPIADALQPALEILVNTGYSDVITPADKPNNPELWYTRSYTTANVVQPFLSVAPLTPQEWARVPGDVLRALVKGFSDVFIPAAASTPPVASVTSAAATAKLVEAPVAPAAAETVVPQAVTQDAPIQADATPLAPAAPTITRSVRKAAAAVKTPAPASAVATQNDTPQQESDADAAPTHKRAVTRATRAAS
jgi:hypothetical protein